MLHVDMAIKCFARRAALLSHMRAAKRTFSIPSRSSSDGPSDFTSNTLVDPSKDVDYCEVPSTGVPSFLTPTHQWYQSVTELEELEESLEAEDHLDERLHEFVLEESIDHIAEPSEKRGVTEAPFIKDFKAYLHACFNANMLEKAHLTFLYYRYRYKDNNVVNISVHNSVIKAWASVGKISKVKELLRVIAHSQIQPNMQTFACHLLCLSRMEKGVVAKEVNQVIDDIKECGLNVERLFVDSVLFSHERASILKMLKNHDINISFQSSSIVTAYEFPLLENFNYSIKRYKPMSIPLDKIRKNYHEQLEMERKCMVKIPSAYQEKESPASLEERTKLKVIWDKKEIEWKNALRLAIPKQLAIIKNRYASYHAFNIYPFLATISVDDMVSIAMDEMMSLVVCSEGYCPASHILYMSMGNKIQATYLSHFKSNQSFSQDLGRIYKLYLNSLSKDRCLNARLFFEEEARRCDLQLATDLDEVLWSQRICRLIGKFLYNIVFAEIKIEDNILCQKNKKEGIINHGRQLPVLYCFYKSSKNKVVEEVKVHPIFVKFSKKVCGNEVSFNIKDLPMLCPPMPWLSSNIGAYHLSPSPLKREDQISNEISHELEKESILPIIDALNSLQAVPWKVNQEVLDVALEVLQRKGDQSLDIPLHSSLLPPVPMVPKNLPWSERGKLVKEAMKIVQQRNEMYSLWCTCVYKLSIANYLRNRVFWLPHNIDFRGRAYTIPPHLTHISDDLCRGLMLFAEGLPLGSKGLTWLKLHVINLTGLKKRAPIEERLTYADEIIDDIIDSADNPLTGRKWWTTSDDPWQTLAACKEYVNALRSGDPENYVSHFPVHQDGSCNGLQHYAALGRDLEGGKSVNLVPADRPQDVYSDVAKIVERRRAADAEQGDEIAKVLEGFVERRVIKQTVMTFVYGVTKYGARAQIAKQLFDIEDFPRSKVMLASAYLAENVIASIKEMFSSSREIQNWLTDCSIVISKILKENVMWTTPIGLPVVQPYSKGNSNQKQSLARGEKWTPAIPNPRKQKNGFAPNFIHSLDATHMMLTALSCEASAFTFVSIHDCFWTHPATVDAMNHLCRTNFVNLHSTQILEDLQESFKTNYSKELRSLTKKDPLTYRSVMSTIARMPRKGSLDLNQVIDSVYFFS